MLTSAEGDFNFLGGNHFIMPHAVLRSSQAAFQKLQMGCIGNREA